MEVKSPFAPLPEEAAKAPKGHRLTAEEKEIKAAVMDTLKGQIAYHNDGMRASYRASNHSFNLLARNGVKIEGNTVTQNGEPLFKIHRRHAARKTQGCYREPVSYTHLDVYKRQPCGLRHGSVLLLCHGVCLRR